MGWAGVGGIPECFGLRQRTAGIEARVNPFVTLQVRFTQSFHDPILNFGIRPNLNGIRHLPAAQFPFYCSGTGNGEVIVSPLGDYLNTEG